MTAPSVKSTGSGFRYAALYALNAAGYPAGTSPTTPYEGLQFEGAQTLELTEGEPRIIPIMGDDCLIQQDVLPSQEGMNGTLTIARRNMALDAIVRGVLNYTVGEAKGLPIGSTDVSGSEPQCGLMAYRQALTEAGARIYEVVFLPKTWIFARRGSYNDGAAEYQYSIVPALVTKHLWGTAMIAGTEGVTRSQGHDYDTQYKPWLATWKADGTATKFSFSTTHQAVATGKIHGVWVDGVVDATVALAVDGVTPTTKPSADQMVVVFYEFA